jgi:hypothetical protein
MADGDIDGHLIDMPPLDAPDEAVFEWPEKWFSLLFVDNLPARSRHIARTDSDWIRKHWVALLRKHERRLGREVPGYANIRKTVRASVISAAAREGWANRIKQIRELSRPTYMLGELLMAAIVPVATFGRSSTDLDSVADSLCGLFLLVTLANLVSQRLFSDYYYRGLMGLSAGHGWNIARLTVVAIITTIRALAAEGDIIHNVLLRELEAFLGAAAWLFVFTLLLEPFRRYFRRRDDPRLVLIIGLMSSMDFANAFRSGVGWARQDLIDELEHTARDVESTSLRQLRITAMSADRAMRADLRQLCRGIARKLRRYKFLVVNGGTSGTEVVVNGLTTDFILACKGEWLAIARPATARTVPTRVILAACLSGAVAIATGVVTNLVTNKPTAALTVGLALLGIATIILSAWQAVLSQQSSDIDGSIEETIRTISNSDAEKRATATPARDTGHAAASVKRKQPRKKRRRPR